MTDNLEADMSKRGRNQETGKELREIRLGKYKIVTRSRAPDNSFNKEKIRYAERNSRNTRNYPFLDSRNNAGNVRKMKSLSERWLEYAWSIKDVTAGKRSAMSGFI